MKAMLAAALSRAHTTIASDEQCLVCLSPAVVCCEERETVFDREEDEDGPYAVPREVVWEAHYCAVHVEGDVCLIWTGAEWEVPANILDPTAIVAFRSVA